MKTEEAPSPPFTAWFEPDPFSPVIGTKQYDKGLMLYRVSWFSWPALANTAVRLTLPRYGIITQMWIDMPVEAMALDRHVRVIVSDAEWLNAPLGLLPRKETRVTLMDARVTPRSGINSEAFARLDVEVYSKLDCVVWIGTQTAHLMR